MDWTSGLDWWTGSDLHVHAILADQSSPAIVDGRKHRSMGPGPSTITGLDWWTGLVDWTGGLD